MRGGPVALLVPRCDPEDDGGLGRRVDVRGRQRGVVNNALGVRAAEDPHEGELGGRGGHRLGVARGVGRRRLDGQVDLERKKDKRTHFSLARANAHMREPKACFSLSLSHTYVCIFPLS